MSDPAGRVADCGRVACFGAAGSSRGVRVGATAGWVRICGGNRDCDGECRERREEGKEVLVLMLVLVLVFPLSSTFIYDRIGAFFCVGDLLFNVILSFDCEVNLVKTRFLLCMLCTGVGYSYIHEFHEKNFTRYVSYNTYLG